MDRFWSKVEKTSQCWLWTAGKAGKGYGSFRISNPRKKVYAHRFAWELTYGPIPKGLFVCHKCDNIVCVNPKHLFLGTSKQNLEDMSRKGRSPNNKLEPKQILYIRKLFSTGNYSKSVLGKMFGVNETTIGRIIRYERWATLI